MTRRPDWARRDYAAVVGEIAAAVVGGLALAAVIVVAVVLGAR